MADEVNTPEVPAAPLPTDGASTEQVAGTETPANAPAPAADGDNRLYGGKYKTVEELENAHKSLQGEYTRVTQGRGTPPVQEPQGGADTRPGYENPAGQPDGSGEPLFDEQTQAALDANYWANREKEKAAEFVRKHKEELADPVLDGTVRRLLAEAREKGEYLEQEAALDRAKKLVEERVKPKAEEARQEGFEQGNELARDKEKLGAIGEGAPRENVDATKLKAEEFAQFKGLPRSYE
jgi:hypothetical protein